MLFFKSFAFYLITNYTNSKSNITVLRSLLKQINTEKDKNGFQANFSLNTSITINN